MSACVHTQAGASSGTSAAAGQVCSTIQFFEFSGLGTALPAICIGQRGADRALPFGNDPIPNCNWYYWLEGFCGLIANETF